MGACSPTSRSTRCPCACASCGAGPAANLTARLDADAGAPAWSATSDTVFFHVARGVSSVLAAVPRAGGPVRIVTDRSGQAGDLALAGTGRAAWVEAHPRT